MPVVSCSLAESVCLTLVVNEPCHGWSLVRTLAPSGDIGRVWSLSRPLTYRAVDALVAADLIVRGPGVVGEGPKRQMLAPTRLGRRASQRWLSEPVDHLRDVRTELILKLVLGDQRGLDPRPLLRAQQACFEPVLLALRSAAKTRNADDVDRWRYESSLAVRRFLDASLRAADRRAAVGE